MNIKYIAVGFVGFVVLMILSSLAPFTTVDSGERGVVKTYGKLSGEVLDPGFHFISPISSVVKVNVQQQQFNDKTEVFSAENQSIYTDVTVMYHLNPNALGEYYTQFGLGGEQKLIDKQVLDTVKAVTVKYSIDKIMMSREEIRLKSKAMLTQKMLDVAKGTVIIDDVSFTNFSFSPTYHKAIEDKQIAEQNALKAQQVLKQVQFEAQQKVAAAEGQAKAQAAINASTTVQSLEYMRLENERQAIQKWDGSVPTTVMGGGANGSMVPFINVPLGKKTTATQQ